MRMHGMDSDVLTLYVSKQAALMALRSVDELTELFVDEVRNKNKNIVGWPCVCVCVCVCECIRR